MRKDAQNLSTEEVKNKLKTLTQGQKSDTVLGNMASTFKALCALADWSSDNKESLSSDEPFLPHQNITNQTALPQEDNKKISDMNLHYNIQIHLPETTNMAVYDAIFLSLKKHLL